MITIPDARRAPHDNPLALIGNQAALCSWALDDRDEHFSDRSAFWRREMLEKHPVQLAERNY